MGHVIEHSADETGTRILRERSDTSPVSAAVGKSSFGAWDGPRASVGRNRLVSLMLQDRSVLRIICAPHGFGKTRLAREYAERLFSTREVVWIDASDPTFLFGLDAGAIKGARTKAGKAPDLLIIDELPWLHERRAAELSHCIDDLLLSDCEVIVTMLPSCNSIRALQSDCILVGARDLLVDREEFMNARSGATREERALIAEAWSSKEHLLYGCAPGVIWDDAPQAQREILAKLFSEHLEIGVLRAMLVIAVLGKGSSEDFDALGIALRKEELSLLSEDYALLEAGPSRFTFDFAQPALAPLAADLSQQGVLHAIVGKAPQLVDHLIDMLLTRGDAARAEEVLEIFFSDLQCLEWLGEHGFELIDRGEVVFVDALIERSDGADGRHDATIWTLRAWSSGLIGDRNLAVHFAQKALRSLSAQMSAGADDGLVPAAAYLALVAFGQGSTAVYGRQSCSSVQQPVTEGEFLASLVDTCSEVELGRALCCDDAERLSELEGQRCAPERTRSNALEQLCMLASERIFGSWVHRLLLHVCFFVDDPQTRAFLQDAGCEVVICAKRRGVTSYTEALVIRDLWQSGYFGLTGAMPNRHNAQLLSQTGKFLHKMGGLQGRADISIPWEQNASDARVEERAEIQQADIPLMRVRLFGSFDVMIGDEYLRDSAWRKKARLLFILLVLNQGKDVCRDVLFDELWQGMSRVRALDNFYTVWSSACNTLGNRPYIERNGEFCRVNSRFVVSDVFEFEQLTRRLLTEHPDVGTILDIYARLEALYRGGLVPSEVDSPLINSRRERYRAMFVDAMVAATHCALEVRDARVALWFARKAYESSDKREDVYCALIQAQIAAGQRCSAIKSYMECRDYLRSELGLSPSEETQELYDQLIKTDPSLLKLDEKTFRR